MIENELFLRIVYLFTTLINGQIYHNNIENKLRIGLQENHTWIEKFTSVGIFNSWNNEKYISLVTADNWDYNFRKGTLADVVVILLQRAQLLAYY